jgi:hypothetical protein
LRSWRTFLVVAVAGGLLLIGLQLPPSHPVGFDFWLGLAGAILLAAFAGVIGWQRPDSHSARLLCLVLIASVFATALSPWNFLRGGETLQLVAWTLAALIGPLAPLFFTYYADTFGMTTPLRRRFVSAQYVLAIPAVLVALAPTVARLWHSIAPGVALEAAVTNPALDLQFICAFVSGVLAIRASRGDDRQRILWATIASAPYIVAAALTGWPGVPDEVGNVALLLWPIGLTYAALRGKLLDVAFAVNRAAVFTVVSAIVLVLFVTFEWFLAEWVKPIGHDADLVLSLGFALVLGISTRLIHHRVDHVIDKVIFRKRNADLAALRSFAQEAPFITNREVLVARTIATVRAHLDATGAAVVSDCGAEENDPAMVALRARRVPVEPHALGSSLDGELALPLFAGATFLGALVCGAKTEGGGYAPDEIAALTAIAGGVAEALLILRGSGERIALLERIAAGQERILDALGAIARSR